MQRQVAPAKPLRRNSSRLIDATQRPTLYFARAKDLISAAYYAITCGLYIGSNPLQQSAFRTFAPSVVAAANGGMTLLHVYGAVSTFRSRRRRRWNLPHFAVLFLNQLDRFLPPKSLQVPLFHAIDVACQSYQAYRLSMHMVHHDQAFVFTLVVSLYSLVTPWFLFAQDTFVRQSIVPIVNNFLGFFLSVGFPLCAFLVQVVRALALDVAAKKDDKFIAAMLVLSRHMIVPTLQELVTRTITQLSSYMALRRLVHSVHTADCVPTSMRGDSSDRITESFRLKFHSRRPLIVYLCLNVMWGATLIYLTTAATFFRTPCPDTCVQDTAPWFDSTCHCSYVEINCATRGIPGHTIDDLLQSSQLGPDVFYIDIRRCALPHGIASATLAQFQNLYAMIIYFSNMTKWPMDSRSGFPPILKSLHVRGSQLTRLPDALLHVPKSLAFLRIQESPIQDIPDEFVAAWRSLAALTLSRLNLSTISNALGELTYNLKSLDLRGNRIATLPSVWSQPRPSNATNLLSVDLSANRLTDAPWALAHAGVKLELSSNAIASVPSDVARAALTSRSVVLDDTPYCDARGAPSCKPKCSALCLSTMIGDFRCDWECYSVACQFDGGDCATFGC